MKKVLSILRFNFIPILFFDQLTTNLTDWVILLALPVVIIGVVIQLIRLTNRSNSLRHTRKEHAERLKTAEQKIGALQKDVETYKRLQHNTSGIPEEQLHTPPEKIEPENPSPVIEMRVTNQIHPDWRTHHDTEIQDQVALSERSLLFAKAADLVNGFSPEIINQLQNGEQVYEIVTNGDEGVYRISADLNAQKYALSDYNYTLRKACEFANQPFKGCEIFLKKEGVLTKIAGDWIIQQKAQIEFK